MPFVRLEGQEAKAFQKASKCTAAFREDDFGNQATKENFHLTTGIQDKYPIPVIGILNERPNGPCINTEVDMEKVKRAVADFLEGSKLPTSSRRLKIGAANRFERPEENLPRDNS